MAVDPINNDLNFAPKVSGIRLHVGSGREYTEGMINIDLVDPNADIKCDAGTLPFNDNKVAQIISIDTIEHISRDEVLPVFREWYRVIKIGGTAIVIVPDIKDFCRNVVEDPEEEWRIATIYGNQSHNGQFHKWGYTPKTLMRGLAFAGFSSVKTYVYKGPDGLNYIYAEAMK